MREDHAVRINTRRRLWEEQNKICAYHNEHIPYGDASLDHIIPVVLLEEMIGEDNLIVCCKNCNESKGNHIVFSNLYDRVIYPLISIPVIFQDRYIHNTKKVSR
jgi:CRISPR/Cas system Type II protein with McrA/HNH and RuvC-like nuclease domain